MKAITRLVPVLILIVGCASTPPAPTKPAQQDLASWLNQEAAKSWNDMLKNISPTTPKTAQGPTAAPGAVVAALSTHDPDYYFHWIRDSSVVMSTVTAVANSPRGFVNASDYQKIMSDYLTFTAKLQSLKSKFGLGEPRYNIDGTLDTSPWSRPQYDGSALRALSLLSYLEWLDHTSAPVDSKWSRLAHKLLKTDVEYIRAHYKEPCFDVWEETNGDNYQTRLAQLAAFERTQKYYAAHHVEAKLQKQLATPITQLKAALQAQWDEKKGYVRSNLNVVSLDKNQSKHTDLDSAVIVAVVETNRDGNKDSVLDDHIEATAFTLEDYFRTNYPINKNLDLAPAMGRYPNDLYVNGNPWYLITANFGQFYYELARRLQKGEAFHITAANCRFVQALLAQANCSAEPKELSPEERSAMITAAKIHGDSFLARVQSVTPADGQLGEQYDKVTGEPRSANGLTWSYEAILSATLARDALAVSN